MKPLAAFNLAVFSTFLILRLSGYFDGRENNWFNVCGAASYSICSAVLAFCVLIDKRLSMKPQVEPGMRRAESPADGAKP